MAAIATELANIREVVARDRVAVMTRRQRQILDGILAGGTSKSIAKELGITPRTVEMHRPI